MLVSNFFFFFKKCSLVGLLSVNLEDASDSSSELLVNGYDLFIYFVLFLLETRTGQENILCKCIFFLFCCY